MHRVMDAMIRHPVLREVVCPDLGGAVTRADLSSPLTGASGLLLGEHLVQQPRPQHLQRLDLVLQLALLILALHHEIGRQVRDAYGAVGRIDALAAGPLRSEDVDPEVLILDLHVDLLRLGQHRDGRGGRMDPPLRLGDGDALDAVYTRFVPERPVHTRAAGREDRFLQAPQGALRKRVDLHLPAAALAESRVHAEQVGREQRGLVAPGSRPYLDDGIAIRQRVHGGEELGEALLQPADLGPQAFHIGPRQLGQLRITILKHLARLHQLALEPLEPVVGLADLV